MMVLRHIGPPSATVADHPTDDDEHGRLLGGGGGIGIGEERTTAIPMDLSNKHSVRNLPHDVVLPRHHLKINNNNNNNNNNNKNKTPLLAIFPTPGVKRNSSGKEVLVVGRPPPSHHHPRRSPNNNNNNNNKSNNNNNNNNNKKSINNNNSSSNEIRWRGSGPEDDNVGSPDSGLQRDSPSGEDEDAMMTMMMMNGGGGGGGRSSSSPPSALSLRSRQSPFIPLSLIRQRFNLHHLNNNNNNNSNPLDDEEEEEEDEEENGGDTSGGLELGIVSGGGGGGGGGSSSRGRRSGQHHGVGGGGRGDDNSGKSSQSSTCSNPPVLKDPKVQTKRARLEQMVSHIKKTTNSSSDKESGDGRDRDRGGRVRSRRHSGDDDTSSGGQGTSGGEDEDGPTDLRRSYGDHIRASMAAAGLGLHHPGALDPHHHLSSLGVTGGLGHGHPLPGLKSSGLPFSQLNAANAARALFSSSSRKSDSGHSPSPGPGGGVGGGGGMDPDEPCNLVCGNKQQASSPLINPLSMPDAARLFAAAAQDPKSGIGGGLGGVGGGGLGNLLSSMPKNFQPLSPSDASKMYGVDPETYQQQMMQLQLTSAAMMGDPGGLLKAMGSYPPWVYIGYYSQLLHSFQAQEILRQYAIQSQTTPTISQGEKSPTIARTLGSTGGGGYNCGSPVSPASASEGPAGMDSDGSIVGQATGGNNGKRAPRAMTGRHVRTGTGASPTTLQTLRKKIEERQRLKAQQLRHDIMLQPHHANSNNNSNNSSNNSTSNKGKHSKFIKKLKK